LGIAVTEKDIETMSPYELATLVKCGVPDSPDSPGAWFLHHLRGDLLEAWHLGRFQEEDENDVVTEISSAAPDIAIPVMWREFVDLLAWRVELDPELEGDDMEDCARLRLQDIAERACSAMLRLLRQR
jgi:hypothetical protein